MICPGCGYRRSEHDRALMPGVCPDCGIAYEKYLAARQKPENDDGGGPGEASGPQEPSATEPEEQVPPWSRRALHYLCFVPSDRHESAFWGHTVLYLCFLGWGWYFIANGIDWRTIGGSFLHGVNLVFHEYGHIAFSPFGLWWTWLGGSLFQVLLPLLPLAYFVVRQRDNFAASLMLWWSGQNLIDVSPYIADAPTRLLPLTGGDPNGHDWWNLLRLADALDAAPMLAGLCFTLGAAVILLSNLWGGFLLYIEFRGRTAPGFGSGSRLE